jgi:hypothetical protein
MKTGYFVAIDYDATPHSPAITSGYGLYASKEIAAAVATRLNERGEHGGVARVGDSYMVEDWYPLADYAWFDNSDGSVERVGNVPEHLRDKNPPSRVK